MKRGNMYLSQLQVIEGEEIVPVIHKAALFGGIIFQQGSLVMQTCSIHRIEINDQEVVMRIKGEHALDGPHALCINMAFRNLTFRIQPGQFELYEDKIVCQVPTEAKAIPSRPGGERHILPFDAHATATLHRIEKRDNLCSFHMKIVDVSKWGLGAYLIGNPEGAILQYDHVWVKEVNGRKLETPFFCRIEYVNERRYKDTTVSRVGLSTDKQLQEEIYQELSKLCRLVLSA